MADKIPTQYELISSKVEEFIKEVPVGRKLILPREQYGPFCLRILNEFKKHFNLPEDLEIPKPELKIHMSLSRIFDIMVHAMGDDIRNIILKELDEYVMSLPAHCRK